MVSYLYELSRVALFISHTIFYVRDTQMLHYNISFGIHIGRANEWIGFLTKYQNNIQNRRQQWILTEFSVFECQNIIENSF